MIIIPFILIALRGVKLIKGSATLGRAGIDKEPIWK